MKKIIASLILASTLLTSFSACGGEEKKEATKEPTKPETTVTEEPKPEPELSVAEKTALGIEQVKALEVTFVAADDNDTLTYTSSNPEVVACDAATGALSGLALGNATITVTSSVSGLSATTEVVVTDPLKGATAAFFGDSICMASTWDKEHQWWGWAGRINEAYGLKSYVNKGVDGASLSDCRENNRIVKQVLGQKGNKFDFIVLHGGTNDGWDKVDVGTISQGFEPEGFDVSTFAGGLEELFYTAKKYFPKSNICYIINFRMNSDTGYLRDMSRYYKVAKVICKKWDIPYLDLYFDEEFTELFQYKTTKYLPDLIHPNSAGYDILYPYIASFMRQTYYGINVQDLT